MCSAHKSTHQVIARFCLAGEEWTEEYIADQRNHEFEVEMTWTIIDVVYL